MIDFKKGDFVSVWERPNRRYRWRLTRAFVLVCRIDTGSISWQESNSGDQLPASWTCATLSDTREVRAPIFDVKPNRIT